MALTQEEQQQVRNRQARGNKVTGTVNANEFHQAQSGVKTGATTSDAAALLQGVMAAARSSQLQAQGAILFNKAKEMFYATGGTASDAIVYLAYLDGNATKPTLSCSLPEDPTIARLVCNVAIGEQAAYIATHGRINDYLNMDDGTVQFQLPQTLDGITEAIETVVTSPQFLLGGAE
jgi:hypothetical protein